ANEQREAFLKAFPHLRDKRILLFLGRLHEKKGCDLLLQAFADLAGSSKQVPAELHLVMAGPAKDEYGEFLKNLAVKLRIDSRVTWTNMLAGDLKWGAFHSAEAFILPSHQENFGIAVAEALACGLPVLISNRVNIWREIRLHGAGFVEGDDLKGTQRLLKSWVALDEDTKTT